MSQLIEILPCKLSHMRELANNLRASDAEEVEVLGRPRRHVLQALWRSSHVRRVALVDGAVAAAWGCTGDMLSSEGEPWLLTTPVVQKAPITFIKNVRLEIMTMLQMHSSLITACLANYHDGLRLLDTIGFDLGPPEGLDRHDRLFRVATLRKSMPRRSPHTSHTSVPFVIYGLCRSRTAWLSSFLSYRDWSCFHEQGLFMRTVDDIAHFANTPYIGSAETNVSLGWRLIKQANPAVKMVVIRRPVEDAHASMVSAYEKAGLELDRDKLMSILKRSERALIEISAQPGTLTVDFMDLTTEYACRDIFEFCLPYAFDRAHWLKYRDNIVQVDLKRVVNYYWQNRTVIENFKRLAKRELIRLVRTGELINA